MPAASASVSRLNNTAYSVRIAHHANTTVAMSITATPTPIATLVRVGIVSNH